MRTEQKLLFAVPFTKYLCVHPNAEGGIPMMSPRTVSSRRTRSDLVALSLAVLMKRSELLRSLWTGIAPDLRCSFVVLGSGSLLTVI